MRLRAHDSHPLLLPNSTGRRSNILRMQCNRWRCWWHKEKIFAAQTSLCIYPLRPTRKIQHVDKSILRGSCFDIKYRKSYLKFKKMFDWIGRSAQGRVHTVRHYIRPIVFTGIGCRSSVSVSVQSLVHGTTFFFFFCFCCTEKLYALYSIEFQCWQSILFALNTGGYK